MKCRDLITSLISTGLLVSALGCSDASDDTIATATVPCDSHPCDVLSSYGFFEGNLADLQPTSLVHPYSVTAELWSDDALKERFLYLPEGATIAFDEGEAWSYPSGTIAIKNFYYPNDGRDASKGRRLIETRLLISVDNSWEGHVYLWNDEQTEAYRYYAGTRVDVSYIDADGTSQDIEYVVPNTNMCQGCHDIDNTMTTLGPFTHQLNRLVTESGSEVNQLTRLSERSLFTDTIPAPDTLPAFADPYGDGDLNTRARSYLHANCSHCHRPNGAASESGLVLLAWEDNPRTYGICKEPAAAGLGTGGSSYDILPGHADDSILVYRMTDLHPASKMPELPNLRVDERGVALISEWVNSLEPVECN